MPLSALASTPATTPATTLATTPATSSPAPRPRPAHLSSASDNWPTPMDFFTALDAEFGFVLDVCASVGNAKAESFYALDHPAADRRDGLAADWAAEASELGGAVWMNPPYGRPIATWMARAFAAAQAGTVVVTLVPVRADTAWWHQFVLATGAEVRFVRGRLTFGDAVNTAAFASAVVVFRPSDAVGAPGPVTTVPAHPVVSSDSGAPTPASPALPETPAAPVASDPTTAVQAPAQSAAPAAPLVSGSVSSDGRRSVHPAAQLRTPAPTGQAATASARDAGARSASATRPSLTVANVPLHAAAVVRPAPGSATSRTLRTFSPPGVDCISCQGDDGPPVERMFEPRGRKATPTRRTGERHV